MFRRPYHISELQTAIWATSRFGVVCVLLASIASPAYSDFPSLIDLALDDPDALIIGSGAQALMGSSMCTGDINGDGFLDLVVAACNATPLGGTRQGEVTIIWGPALGDSGTIDLAIEQSQVSRIFGQLGDDPIFCGVACGDFNNDGYYDIILGEPSTPSSTWQGKAYVILGESEFPDSLDLAASPPLVFTIVGHASSGVLGMGLCACDVNGDGYDEVVVAAIGMDYAEVYLIHGGESFQTTYYTGQNEPGMTRIVDQEWRRGTGGGIACRDIDGDGYDDLFVGAPGIDIYYTYDGRATLLFGRSVLPDTVLLSDNSWRTVTILPEYPHGQLGRDVTIGDFDHDGQYDLVVSAYQADPLGCENCGEVYVLYNAVGLPETVRVDTSDVPITRLLGNGTHWFGLTVLADDLTGDSYDEIVVGDWPDGTRARVAVGYGHTLPSDTVFRETDTTLSWIIEESQGTRLGNSLASGDFNGDGVGDLVVGAKRASPLGRSNAGAAYVFYGVASSTAVKTPERPPDLVLKPNFPNPFSTNTSFHFYLPRTSDVTVTVYDVLGRRIATMVEPLLEQGENILTWDGRDASGRQLPSGVYFYRVEAAGLSQTRKFVLTR